MFLVYLLRKGEFILAGKTKITNRNKEIINGLMPFLANKTGRVPIILPIIMNINTKNSSKI